MNVETYVLAKKSYNGSYQFVTNPENKEVPVCFSATQAEFFMEFAESRIPCESGEILALLKGKLDLSCVHDSNDLAKLISGQKNLNEWELISIKEAEDRKSWNYREKVLSELNSTWNELKNDSLLQI